MKTAFNEPAPHLDLLGLLCPPLIYVRRRRWVGAALNATVYLPAAAMVVLLGYAVADSRYTPLGLNDALGFLELAGAGLLLWLGCLVFGYFTLRSEQRQGRSRTPLEARLALALLGGASIVVTPEERYSLDALKLLRHALLAIGWGACALSTVGVSLGNFDRARAGAWEALLWLLPALMLFAILVTAQRATRSRPEHPDVSHRLRFLPLTAVVTIMALTVGAIGAALVWRGAGDMVYRRARAEARAAGYRSDLPRSSKPDPGDDNSVTWLARANAALGRQSLGGDKIQDDLWRSDFFRRVRAGTIRDDDVAIARTLVERNREALGFLDKAAAALETTWGVDWNRPRYKLEGPTVVLRGRLSNLARLRAAEAIILARAGKGQEAADKLRAGFWLGDAVSASAPLLITGLIGLGINTATLDAAETILAAVPAHVALNAWEPFLKVADEARLADALIYELYGHPELFASLGWWEAVSYFFNGDVYIRPPNTPGQTVDALFALVYWPFMSLDMAMYVRYLRALERDDPAVRDERYLWRLGKEFLPLFNNIQARGRIAKARRRAVRVAIAVRMYAAHVGRLPDSLEDLTRPATNAKAEEVGAFLAAVPLPGSPAAGWSPFSYTTSIDGTFTISAAGESTTVRVQCKSGGLL